VRFHTVFFDLDGTVVDAFTTIYRSYVHTLPLFGFPAPTMEQVRRAVGGGLEKAMSHFVPEGLIAEAVKVHVDYSETILLEDARLYPGAVELISSLHARGVKTAILTNKIGDQARALITHFKLDLHLDLVFGARDFAWRKPAPEFTAEALRRLGSTAGGACIVGDSPFDVQTALNAGFPCLCVTTGTHDDAQLLAAGAATVHPDLFSLAREFE
jgi:phosphoglycolate phosphatase-like HAD superfamily hydrolase